MSAPDEGFCAASQVLGCVYLAAADPIPGPSHRADSKLPEPDLASGLDGRSKVLVTLDDASEHRFDYGIMSAKKIAAAIQG